MSDERLRQLERGGDRARLLAERLRAGTLTRDRLELAAWCGDRDARQLVSHEVELPGPAWDADSLNLPVFAQTLMHWGLDVFFRDEPPTWRVVLGDTVLRVPDGPDARLALQMRIAAWALRG